LEDVIEEILGEINDEFDEDDSLFIELDENRFVFDGKIPLSEFFKVVDLEEQDYLDDMGEADTLAGWLLEMKGDFPRKGEELKCKQIAFKVIEKKDRRIARIQVEIKKR
jgi:CBS domain containing-hemolysin-like protein